MLVRPITVDGVVTSALGVEPGPAGGAGTVDQSIGTILQHLPVRLVALDDRGIVVFSAGAFPTRTDGGGTEGPQPAELGARYAPIAGYEPFLRGTIADLLGGTAAAEHAVAVASPGGTGALRHAMLDSEERMRRIFNEFRSRRFIP